LEAKIAINLLADAKSWSAKYPSTKLKVEKQYITKYDVTQAKVKRFNNDKTLVK